MAVLNDTRPVRAINTNVIDQYATTSPPRYIVLFVFWLIVALAAYGLGETIEHYQPRYGYKIIDPYAVYNCLSRSGENTKPSYEKIGRNRYGCRMRER